MESKTTLLAVCLAVVLVFIVQQGRVRGQLSPPVCQTWNSTTVVCRGEDLTPEHPWKTPRNPTRATLTQVPVGIPESVITLDLSLNNITELYNDSFRGLRKLRYLDLYGNILNTIEASAFAGLKNLQRLNITILRGPIWRQYLLPYSASTFSLQHELFQDLRNLKYLAVETSTDSVSKAVFNGLTKLKYLDLRVKNVTNLPDRIFDSLTSLESLWIVDGDHTRENQNTTMKRVHSGNGFLQRQQLWAPLYKLKSFRLSVTRASNLYFGSVFRNMLNLDNLKIDIQFGIQFNREMFQPLYSTLKHLDVGCFPWSFCPSLIKHGLLKSFTNLQTLSLLNLQYFKSADLLHELRHTQIQELSLSLDADIITSDTLAGVEDLKYLKTLYLTTYTRTLQAFSNFSHLKKLDLSGGAFETLENKAFSSMPSLTHLDMSHNKLSTLQRGAFEGLSSLVHVDVSSNQLENFVIQLPDAMDYLDLRHIDYLDLSHNNLYSDTITSCSLFVEGVKSVRHLNLSYNRFENVGMYCLPGNITVLDLQHNNVKTVPAHGDGGETVFDIEALQYLDLSHNSLTSDSFNLIRPRLSNLKTLKLDDNDFVRIDGDFLKHLINLKTLTLSHNHIHVIETGNVQWLLQLTHLDLNHNEIDIVRSSAFRGLSRLRFLDLSYNQIQTINEMIFEDLSNLTHLNLAHNRIAVIGNAFHRLYGLRNLILRSNSLTVLNQTALVHVFNRLETLDIADNPFTCDCNLLWFVEWAQYDNVVNFHNAYPPSHKSYMCSRPADLRDRRLMEGLADKEQHTDRREASERKFFNNVCSQGFQPNRRLAAVLASSGIFVSMVTIFLVSYHIGRVQYLLWLLAKWRRPKIGEVENNEPHRYTHDAFIAYNNKDVRWVVYEAIENLEPDYSLVIHDRDFAVGAPIVTNIADAVENSRRTVCIITRNFLKSKWCEYEFQLAQYHMFEQGGREVRLILVFLERIPNRMLKRFRHLNAVMKRDTYLEWPDAPRKLPLFWRRLREALGDPLPRDAEAAEELPAPAANIPEHQAQAPERNIPDQQAQDPDGNIPEQQAPGPEGNIPEQQAQIPVQIQVLEQAPMRNIQEQQVAILLQGPDDQWYKDGDGVPLLPL